MKNNELRLYAAGKGVRLWQVAARFGITDAMLSRRLRTELSSEEAEQFKNYVDQIALDSGGNSHE